jgi:hypothetical protein
MKKFLIISFFAVCLGCFYACKNEKEKPGEPAETQTMKRPGPHRIDVPDWDDMYFTVRGELDSLDGLLTNNLAWQMSQAYKNDDRKARYEKPDHSMANDARSIWFSLETLKKFMAKIESSLRTENGESELNLGVRIYYAKYPVMPDPRLKRLAANVAYRHTVFMVPTYMDTDTKKDIDFNFYHVGNKRKPTPYFRLLDSIPEMQPAILGSFNIRDLMLRTEGLALMIDGIQNQGGLAPPPGSAGSFPTPAN